MAINVRLDGSGTGINVIRPLTAAKPSGEPWAFESEVPLIRLVSETATSDTWTFEETEYRTWASPTDGPPGRRSVPPLKARSSARICVDVSDSTVKPKLLPEKI